MAEHISIFDDFAAYVDEQDPNGPLHTAYRKEAEKSAQDAAGRDQEQKIRDAVVARLAQGKPEDAEELKRYVDKGEISKEYLQAARKEVEKGPQKPWEEMYGT